MPALLSLTVADDAATWRALGFAIANDADTPRTLVGATSIVFAGEAAGRGILGWELSDDGWTAPAGIAVEGLAQVPHSQHLAVSAGSPTSAHGTHQNGIVAIDHLVVSTPDVERTVAAFSAHGMECRGRRVGNAGRHTVHQAFFWLGRSDVPANERVILELVGPSEPNPAKSDDPCTFFGIAFTSNDLALTASVIGENLKPPTDAVQPGRQIATISSKAGSSVPIAVMSPHR